MINWQRNAVADANGVFTPWREFWRRFCHTHVAMSAAVFILLLTLLALFAPWIAPFDAENYFDYNRLNEGPSLIHWFGVDALGSDIFSRMLVVVAYHWWLVFSP